MVRPPQSHQNLSASNAAIGRYMKKTTSGHGFRVIVIGYLLFMSGAAGMIADFVARSHFGYPFNLGIVLGNGAITLLGLVTVIVGQCLRALEREIRRNE